ncbi:MAG: YebC/PmpR family DNA-binding transcriptional regulator, partial [Candidatus Methylumidiphilus sp.]
GIAVLVDCLTDNRNRTVGEVRHAFSKAGGNLGTDGSVAYLFSKVGIISFPSGVDEEAVMEAALEAGADDVIGNDDGSVDVITSQENFESMKAALADTGLKSENAELTMRAATSTSLGQEDAEKLIRLIERLEALDDVQNVYSNADISEEILEKIA